MVTFQEIFQRNKISFFHGIGMQAKGPYSVNDHLFTMSAYLRYEYEVIMSIGLGSNCITNNSYIRTFFQCFECISVKGMAGRKEIFWCKSMFV